MLPTTTPPYVQAAVETNLVWPSCVFSVHSSREFLHKAPGGTLACVILGPGGEATKHVDYDRRNPFVPLFVEQPPPQSLTLSNESYLLGNQLTTESIRLLLLLELEKEKRSGRGGGNSITVSLGSFSLSIALVELWIAWPSHTIPYHPIQYIRRLTLCFYHGWWNNDGPT